MKNLVFIFFISISFPAWMSAQVNTDISFDFANQKITPVSDLSAPLKLPLKIFFASSFQGKTLQLHAADGAKIDQGIFGTDIHKPDGGDAFAIIIGKDRIVSGIDDHEFKINGSSFTVNLENAPDHKITVNIQGNPSTGTTANSQEGYQPGYLFYDALVLHNRIVSSNYDDVMGAIKKHYGLTLATVTNNPFLKESLSPTFTDDGAQGLSGNVSKKIFSAAGGLDVTHIADGLARFIVDRAKQELNAYFFEEFRNKINASVELKILFPQTHLLLNAIGDKVYNYNSYITGLRESFEQDLSGLFVSLPKLMDEPRYVKAFDQVPGLRVILKSSFHVVNELNNDVHPGDILHHFPTAFGADELDENIQQALRVADHFTQSLRSRADDRYWVPYDSIKLILKKDVFKIYLGLLYQTLEDDLVFTSAAGAINFKEQLSNLGIQWNTVDTNIKSYSRFVSDLGLKANTITTRLKGIQAKTDNQPAGYKDIYAFMDAALNLLEYAREINTLPYIEGCLPAPTLKSYGRYLFVARNASNLYLNLNERNYGTGVMNVISILDTLFTDAVWLKTAEAAMGYADKLADIRSTVAVDKQVKEIEALDKEKTDNFKQLKKVKGQILKYGTFMASVVGADNADEVKAIIESTALPAGSSRIKRESKFNVAVNSFVGPFAGHEFIEGVSDDKTINNLALSAPVGISFSWGGFRGKAEKPGWSLGGFISLIDLGALASFRFGDDSTATASKIELRHIVAPGAFLSIGFPKAPFSLSIGGQLGPLLREVTASENTVLDNSYRRFGLSLAVDIPLWNLYNRERD